MEKHKLKSSTDLKLSNIAAGAVLVAAAALTCIQWKAQLKPPALSPAVELASERFQGFNMPNFRMDPVRAYLPERGTISMITDHPYEVGKYEEELFYRAQNFLAPLVINRTPEEKLAIVVCTSPETAETRLAETGYSWVKNFNNGKGIASRTL